MTKIASFEVSTVEIPMRMSVEHALAKRVTARNVLVEVRDDEGRSGWGESCPRPYVTGETVESVLGELRERMLPRWIGKTPGTLEETAAALERELDGIERTQQAAFCALELALLDLVGRHRGTSAGDVLGPVVTEKPRYSGVLATEDPAEVPERSTMMAKFGIAHLKVKVVSDLDTNRHILELAREAVGPDVELRLDANAAWDASEAIRQLEALAEFDLRGVEQPVRGDDWAGMQAVTAAGLVPVVADETLCSVADAERLIAERGCDVFNVRISKCGGLINSGRIHRLGQAAGLKSQLGAQVGETGFLSAAGRQFATRCEPIWCEGSYGKLLLQEDITDPDVTVGPGGFAPALTSPGLGVAPIAERIEAHRTESFVVS